MTSPLNLYSPEVGEYTPVRILKTVVFPAPFGPISPTSSFSFISRLKSVTALRAPKVIDISFAFKIGLLICITFFLHKSFNHFSYLEFFTS